MNDFKKIHGLYNTFEDNYINQLCESQVYREIRIRKSSLYLFENGTIIKGVNDYSKEKYEDEKYNLEYLIYLTRKYGVEFDDEVSSENNLIESESFISWFNMWTSYFDNLPPYIYYEYINDTIYGRDLSKYKPEVSFKDLNRKLNKYC